MDAAAKMHHDRLMKTKAELLVRAGVNSSVHVEDKDTSTGAGATEAFPTQVLTVIFLPMGVDQSYKHWGDESGTFLVINELTTSIKKCMTDFVTSCSSCFASNFIHSISNTLCKGDANVCFNHYMRACFINEVIITVVNRDIGLEHAYFRTKTVPKKKKKTTSLLSHMLPSEQVDFLCYILINAFCFSLN